MNRKFRWTGEMTFLLFAIALLIWTLSIHYHWKFPREQVDSLLRRSPLQISGTTRTAQPVPSATPAVVRDELLPAGLEVIERDTVTYVYRLGERGERVWSEASRISAGRLVKVQGCQDGFRQVEYQPDLEKPGWWQVEWLRCGPLP